MTTASWSGITSANWCIFSDTPRTEPRGGDDLLDSPAPEDFGWPLPRTQSPSPSAPHVLGGWSLRQVVLRPYTPHIPGARPG